MRRPVVYLLPNQTGRLEQSLRRRRDHTVHEGQRLRRYQPALGMRGHSRMGRDVRLGARGWHGSTWQRGWIFIFRMQGLGTPGCRRQMTRTARVAIWMGSLAIHIATISALAWLMRRSAYYGYG